ncbi:hypothetical protein EII14_00055 [Alloprevotella sp. OH1205_COT-284]|nr:hypothetical protein EII14_00055 [Alloprevotella sp. OH1205_COT-284]
MAEIICRLCAIRPLSKEELGHYLRRNPDYLFKRILGDLIAENKLAYLYPNMPKHRKQAYRTPTKTS